MEQKFQFFTDTETPEDELQESADERILKVRLDKWLWAARFFKTRAVARAAVEKGRVFYNGERSSPSREIEIGAILQIRHGNLEKTVIVKGLSTRRRSTEEALQLFEETVESRLAREQILEWQPTFSYNPSFQGGEQSRERRVVRFLRRSLTRGQARENTHSLTSQQPELEICD